MRITIILFFSGVICTMAKPCITLNDRVTINKQNENHKFLLNEIEIQTDKSINDQNEEMSTTCQPPKKKISGLVTDLNGEPIIGANIVEINETINGTITDFDGNFSLLVEENAILHISYIGYLSQDVDITGKTNIVVILQEDTQILDELVVTALGVKRETKALTYNIQEIKAEELTSVKDVNFVNSLAGKIAGVQINNSASGIGGSSRVVMRGTKSLFGENNALYVIDGVPILNTKQDQPDSFFESPDGGDSDPVSFLNTEDVESISVLTGAAAAALYGSQGANGVILITTKKGEAGKLKLTYSNNSQFMTPFVMPRFQNTYGSIDNGFNSWGAKLETPTSYNPTDFFQTAYTEMNALSASVGTVTNQTYLSLGHMQARGLIPNNNLSRINVNIRNSTDLIHDKLSLDLSISYTRHNDLNMMTQGQYHNPLLPLYLFPRGDDFEKYKVYERYNADRNFKTQFWPYGNQGLGMQNPYWIAYKENFNNITDRYSLTASLRYELRDWINVLGRVRIDNTDNIYTRKISASSDLLFASENGYYQNRELTDRQTYADILANIDKRFEFISLTSTIGASIMDMQNEVSGLEGFLVLVPDFFSFENIDMADAQTRPIQSGYHDQTQALFATFQVGYKSLVYLDLTARNEWASQLAFTNDGTSFFYPSVGLSGIISDMANIPKDIVSFLKIRGSYSEVGNAPHRFITRNSYGMTNGSLNIISFYPAVGLKPELTKAFEVGVNIRFWKNKFNLDATYYNTNTYNQLFEIEAGASAIGVSSAYINAGKVNNQGIELSLGYTDTYGPVQWNSNLTYTLNRNKIIELVPEGTIDPTTGESMSRSSFIVSANGTYRMELHEGQPMGDIYVSTLRKDQNGYVHVDSESGAVTADPNNWIKAGNVNPKYNMGWNNSFSFKGFELGFLIDARVGGVGVSVTQALMDRYGVSETTAIARDEGGVLVNGGRLNPQSYYSIVGGGTTGILSEYIYSSTNVRLREATLGYTFPSKWFNGYIDHLYLSLIGKNLWMIYNKAPYDPEITASTGTYYQGFDYFMQPSLKSIGFSVKIQF